MEVGVEVNVEVEVDATLSFRHSLDGVQILFRVGGWLEKWGLKLTSTQVVVEVEVGVELGNKASISVPMSKTLSVKSLLFILPGILS